MTSATFDFASQSRIAQLARTYWLPTVDGDRQQKEKKPFHPDLVERIYSEDMISFGFSHRRSMILELAQYLECWLWPNFDELSSRAHVISICAMVNEKARERVPIWQCFLENPDHFDSLVNRVIAMILDDPIDIELLDISGDPLREKKREAQRKCLTEHVVLITFLSHCLTSLAEVGVLRRSLKETYSLAVWRHLQPQRLDQELANNPRYRKLLRKLEKSAASLPAAERDILIRQRAFVANFIDKFLGIIESLPANREPDALLSHYLQRSLLLLIDFSSMLLTRRFLMILIDDRHAVVRCQNCVLYKEEGKKEGCLFTELVDIFAFYAQFQVDASTGEAVDADDLDRRHCAQMNKLQLTVFSESREGVFREFAVANPVAYESKEKLADFLRKLSLENLHNLAAKFKFVAPRVDEKDRNEVPPSKKRKTEPTALVAYPPHFSDKLFQKDTLIKLLVYHFAIRESHLAQMNRAPLYPTEELLWNEHLVPNEFFSGDECLALPKLGLQFLTLQDYLMRNFTLFRLESTFEIRQDLEDSVSRMKPWLGEQGQVVFDGWSRMALPLQAFSLVEVGRPVLGARAPSRVRADVRVVLSGLRQEVQREWLALRRHDPVFLVTVQPKSNVRNWRYNPRKPFLSQIGILAVRGCEIEGQVDKAGKLIPDEERLGLIPGKGAEFDVSTTSPTWRVALDACQYQADIDRLREAKGRGKALRAEAARARREGRPREAIEALERRAAEADASSPEDIYDTFNVLVRRKPKENNFKAVLDTIRDLMNTRSVVPDWLLDLLMGYLDPAAAHYSRRPECYDPRQNWFDTFLSAGHLRQSFPQYKVNFVDARYKTVQEKAAAVADGADPANLDEPPPPYRIKFPALGEDPTAHVKACLSTEDRVKPSGVATAASIEAAVDAVKPTITAESYTPVGSQVPWELLTVACPTWLPGSSASSTKPGNRIPFTPRQIEAIRAGMQPGLTMIVGPPGTGKTDIAVQTIHNLYHNYPGQRILVVTHSNQALNQLFEKIIALDIDERHLLRLGHGEEALATTKDFSRYGRVDYILSKRIELLQKVFLLRKSLQMEMQEREEKSKTIVTERDATGAPEAGSSTSASSTVPETQLLVKDVDENAHQMFTCETAQYFFLQEVLPRWENFISDAANVLKEDETTGSGPSQFVGERFPFTSFITGRTNPPKQLVSRIFPGHSLKEDLSTARSCFRAISAIFNNLEEFRAFELMRTGLERANFLLTQEAKIVAMTCTHAALKRRDLVQLGFTYDTIIMEEAAQILEIETFIPLLLQNPDISGCNRLKRWIMIGDHNQLPPVVKNQAFNNFSNMGQSLFTRLVKLGVPTIQLDSQGRTRPSISRLYSWRYDHLSDIPHVINSQEYNLCNPGFRYECQVINVEDFKGVGESEPSPYFYQNLAEAEYVVATFMYMRILGYPADSITILTTYNGQKHLIRDVINARCASNPLLGKPRAVTTVDRFQGQQNDYVLVSLVRTHTVGHLRDVRRLVVALSRARLGLYIFARVDQFANCQELRPAFDRLLGRRGLGPDGEVRPIRLHLTPWETWRDPRNSATTDLRLLKEKPSFEPVVIDDMPMMATYVSKLYEERVKEMMSRYTPVKRQKKALTPRVSPKAPAIAADEAGGGTATFESATKKEEVEKREVVVDSDSSSSEEGEAVTLEDVKVEAIPATLDVEIKHEGREDEAESMRE